MKSFVVGLGIGVGLGVLFAPRPGDDTRRKLRERMNSITDDAQQMAHNLAQGIRDGVPKGDQSTELPPKKQATEGVRSGASNTEATVS